MHPSLPTIGTLHFIQFLRLVAALGVVLLHANNMAGKYLAGPLPLPNTGTLGVQLFFVISGFIMVLSAYRNAGEAGAARHFLWRRFVRIAPLYWLITLCFIIIKLAIPGLFTTFALGWWHSIASFLFLPASNNLGSITPVVNVGWTLNFEMFFYLTFAAGMLHSRRALDGVVSLVLLAGACAALLPATGMVLVDFFTHPYLLLFLLGYWSARLFLACPQLSGRHCCALALLVLTNALVWWPQALEQSVHDVAVFGPFFALLCLLGARYHGRFAHLVPRLLVALGDSSYSLYLTHIVVLALFGKLCASLWPAMDVVAFLLAGIVLSIAVGHAVYWLVERPLIRLLRPSRKPAPTM